jgi:hypothetical protein
VDYIRPFSNSILTQDYIKIIINGLLKTEEKENIDIILFLHPLNIKSCTEKNQIITWSKAIPPNLNSSSGSIDSFTFSLCIKCC